MGSLASRPKIPKITQKAIYVSATPPATPQTPAGIPQTTAVPASTVTNETLAAQARNLGLLDRTRGRISTVLTGFRGVLSQSGHTPQRKTLLGE